MNGLELSRAYFEAYGRPMLERDFPELLPFLAAGLLGRGSECFGFDDALSRDHDFEPGFCLFLPGEDRIDRRQEFLLERAYAKLPREFEGLRRAVLQPTGGARHGALRTAEFFTKLVGTADGALSLEQWLSLPEQALAEATNGELFAPGDGLFAAIREKLLSPPRDVRLKRLAGRLLLMAQSGQYNYQRCLKHGETGAAQLAVGEFVKNTLSAVFLLNRAYMPYYKWSFRALKALPGGEDLGRSLEWLLTTDNGETIAEDKYFCMEGIASQVIDLLQEQGLTGATCGDLEKHAYSVNDGIKDGEVRNLHILYCVE